MLMAFAIVPLIGLLALAVDLGWGHFRRKVAQTAADAGALAGIRAALETVGNGRPVCGFNVVCQNEAPCPSTIQNPPANNLEAACLYARRNGFESGGPSGGQNLSVAAGVSSPPSTAPGVNGMHYWITVRVSEHLPGLFSYIFSSRGSVAAARATAVITDGALTGSLYLLNRENDGSPVGTGVNLDAQGNPDIVAPGGILLASTAHGDGGNYAAHLQGNPSVQAPFSYIRGAGTAQLGGSASWVQPPQSGFQDGAYFNDPMSGKGQPAPLPAGGLNNYVAVPDGCLDCLDQPLRPGQYYAVDSNQRATGGKLTISGTATFSDGGGGFGNYVLYGGLSVSHKATANFSPGRYVLAGVQSEDPILTYGNQAVLTDQGPQGRQNSDAGEIFIFTDANYPGLAGNIPPAITPEIQASLGFGPIELQTGNNAGMNLHGLNRTHSQLPSDLQDFAPTVFWQDQRNSRVKYDSSGKVDFTSCGGGGHDINNPCTNPDMADSNTPRIALQAHPDVYLYGLVYQPRGAWMSFQGHRSISSSVIFVSGALDMQGGAELTMLESRDELRRRVAALVE